MSSILDSEAQLRARAAEVGLTEGAIQAIVQGGAASLSSLAFTVGQPGQPIAQLDVDNFLTGCLQRAPTLAEAAAVRRLAFEAQTLLVASLRQVVDQREDSAPRKIGSAERETRMAAIRVELGGIDVSEENEPSHALLDKACQIHDNNSVKYLEPASCTSRSMEVQGGAKTKELAFESGALVVRDKEDKTQAPTDTEMKLHFAMVRRGIAFKFARLMTFEQHCKWTSFLFSAMQRDAPPGYAKPSLHQVMQCDKAAFTRLGSSLRAVRQHENGTFPLGEALLELRADPTIALHLAPLARAASSGQPRPGPYQPQATGQHQPQQQKGKGKSKTKGKTPPMPLELRNKWHKNAAGEPLCFGYNTTKGCNSGVKDGERCTRGWHLCAEPKCLQAHSLQAHPKRS